jgi:hypothetical protein
MEIEPLMLTKGELTKPELTKLKVDKSITDMKFELNPLNMPKLKKVI